MIRPAAVLALALVLLAAPALAEEPDAETRFHDAYVLEVIDGEIAEAAKAYLGLMDDEAVPQRIRQEARFRFAILTVLLGRPDEGRMQLAAVVADERAPASLRERAKAYLESISTLGVGTELERKLQSLVFDLGRADPYRDVPAYRDVEIIGKTAIPFLERLLEHEDRKLRLHAFRLLLRLGAEDAMARWRPDVALFGQGLCTDLHRYLTDRPEVLARFEATLLDLDDQALLRSIRHGSPWPPWSVDFVRALVARGGDLLPLAFGYLRAAGTPAERWDFARECLQGDDPLRRQAAARWAVDQADDPPDDLAATLWLPVVRELAPTPGPWFEKDGRGGARLAAWARRLDTGRLFEALHALVPIGEAADEGQPNPLVGFHLVSLLANVLAERELEGPALDAWEGLVKRWAAAIAPLPESETTTFAPVTTALRDVLRRLPPERAASLVTWLFAGPAHERADRFGGVVRIERPEDTPLLVAAVRAVDRAQQEVLLRRLPRLRADWPGPDLAQAELGALPGLVDLTSVEAVDDERPGRTGLLRTVAGFVDRVPDEALATAIGRLFEVTVAKGGGEPALLFDRLVDFNAQTAPQIRQKVAFYARFVLPALDALHDRLAPGLRRKALDWALQPFRARYGLDDRDRSALAAYVLRHLDDLAPNEWGVLALHTDSFPLVRWLPSAPSGVLNASTIVRHELRNAEVDEAMKILAADPATISDPVLAVLASWASREVSRPVIDRMLGSGDPTLRHRALVALRKNSGYPASPDGLESALAGLLAEEAADLGDLAHVADLLSRVQPSERLLPATERLLGADDREANLQGILLAKRLGRPSLIPALARLLDSLDASLRDQALAAIQAIRELERLKAEPQPPR